MKKILLLGTLSLASCTDHAELVRWCPTLTVHTRFLFDPIAGPDQSVQLYRDGGREYLGTITNKHMTLLAPGVAAKECP